MPNILWSVGWLYRATNRWTLRVTIPQIWFNDLEKIIKLNVQMHIMYLVANIENFGYCFRNFAYRVDLWPFWCKLIICEEEKWDSYQCFVDFAQRIFCSIQHWLSAWLFHLWIIFSLLVNNQSLWILLFDVLLKGNKLSPFHNKVEKTRKDGSLWDTNSLVV